MGERRRQRDLQDPLRPALLLDHLAERLIDPVERLRNDRQNVPPGLGQHELLGAALEQRDAEKILEHDHMTADRALRDGQAIGGGGEAEMLPSRFERSERVERQPFAIHSSSGRIAFISPEFLRARENLVHNPFRAGPTIRSFRRNCLLESVMARNGRFGRSSRSRRTASRIPRAPRLRRDDRARVGARQRLVVNVVGYSPAAGTCASRRRRTARHSAISSSAPMRATREPPAALSEIG